MNRQMNETKRKTRRDFLELSAKVAAGGCVLGAGARASAQMMSSMSAGMVYGVQMFMVRKQAASDLAGALKAIHDAGFNQVELYPIAYKHPAAELKTMMGDVGLRAVAGHFDYTGRDMSIEYAHGLGLRYLVCPMLPEDQKLSLDGFKKAAEHFSGWGEATKKAGMQFAFHNHDYEFKPIGGSNGWTVLMNGTDAATVKLEFDMFWLTTAGQNPAEMLRKYANRAVLVHMKDRVAGAPNSYVVSDKATSYCTELGKGTIDWPALLKQAKAQGIRYAFLDQDDTKIPVDASMKASHDYLQTVKV
jgi:sugar phosphate isomerase/epimerase